MTEFEAFVARFASKPQPESRGRSYFNANTSLTEAERQDILPLPPSLEQVLANERAKQQREPVEEEVVANDVRWADLIACPRFEQDDDLLPLPTMTF